MRKNRFFSILSVFMVVLLLMQTSACSFGNKKELPESIVPVNCVPSKDQTDVSPFLSALSFTYPSAIADVHADKIRLTSADGKEVSLGKPEVIDCNVSVEINERLAPNTSYKAELEAGAFKAYDGTFSASYTLPFTTGNIPDNADETAPALMQTYPENNSDSFNPSGEIMLLFDEPVMQGKNFGNISLTASGVPASFRTEIAGAQVTFTGDLVADTLYTLTVPAAALRDCSMNDYGEDIIINFKTLPENKLNTDSDAAAPAPKVTACVPRDGMRDVSPTTVIKVVYDKNISGGDAYGDIKVTASDGANVLTGKRISGCVLELNAELKYSESYTVNIPQNAVNGADAKSFSFMTAAKTQGTQSGDTSAPQVSLTAPENDAKNVSPDLCELLVMFNENISNAGRYFDISLCNSDGAALDISVSISGAKLLVRLNELLTQGTKYILTLPAGCVADISGNISANEVKVTFTTAQKPLTTAPDKTDEATTLPEIPTQITQAQTVEFAGTEFPQDIQEISLENTEITDLSPLKSFTSLKSLTLKNAAITDISAIAGVTTLTKLDLEFNAISDISPLNKLVNLESLNLKLNRVEDISALSQLKKLKFLNLSNNSIKSVSALSALSELTELCVTDNEIQDISAMTGLKKLERFEAEFNKIESISALSGLVKLKKVYLSKNLIADISPLKDSSALQELFLSGNKIQDVTCLTNLKALTVLILSDNPIASQQVQAIKTALPSCEVMV